MSKESGVEKVEVQEVIENKRRDLKAGKSRLSSDCIENTKAEKAE